MSPLICGLLATVRRTPEGVRADRPAPPLDLTGPQAAQEAADELAKGKYRPNPISQVIQRVLDWIQSLFDGLGRAATRGSLSTRLLLFAILVGLVALIVFAIARGGGIRRRRGLPDAVLESGDDTRSPADYRAEADARAAAGDFNAAVRARFRACVGELVHRTVLEDRPGRTAFEAAAEAAAAMPDLGDRLFHGARLFNEVVFGSRRAGPDDYAAIVALDDAVRRARISQVQQ